MGIAERKESEKSARRQLILDSASAVFREKGFAESTIGDIAERAEIAKGTIYLYFKSKADLYFSLTKPAIENLSMRLTRIAGNRADTPDARIRKLVYAVYDFYEQDVDAYNLVTHYRAAQYADLFPRDRVRGLRRLMRTNLRQMEIVIEEGISKGYFCRINPYSGAVVFWSAFIGIIQFQDNRMMPGKGDYRRETLDLLIETMLHGLLKK
jgi:AcrR family transcriptional regulator